MLLHSVHHRIDAPPQAARPPRTAWGPRVRPRNERDDNASCCCARSITVSTLRPGLRAPHAGVGPPGPTSQSTLRQGIVLLRSVHHRTAQYAGALGEVVDGVGVGRLEDAVFGDE